MTRSLHLLWKALSGGALLAAGGAAYAQAAPARTVENVAQARWSGSGRGFAVQSNRVTIEVGGTSQAPTTPLLNRMTGGAGAGLALDASSCGALPDATVAERKQVRVTPEDSFHRNQAMVFTVTRPSANLNPLAIDRFTMVVTTADGDRETIQMVETDANSGEFAGLLRASSDKTSGNCRLGLDRGGTALVMSLADGTVIGRTTARLLVDPFGIVFDSRTGAPVNGATVSLVLADSGEDAAVFGDDGVSAHPNVVQSGASLQDSGGTRYDPPEGGFRFPLVPPGRYRVVVTPPGTYRAPSLASPAQIATLTRPGGGAFVVNTASFGNPFELSHPDPFEVDVPVDPPSAGVTIEKRAQTSLASPGDVVQFRIRVTNRDSVVAAAGATVSDRLPQQLRVRSETVRWNGAPIAVTRAPGGFSVALPTLAASASGELTYLAEVRLDARSGVASNSANVALPGANLTATSVASVRIVRDPLADRITIVGRVLQGDCSADPSTAPGLPGVRLILPNGQFAITDRDGRYHFEGVRRGATVVAIDRGALPPQSRAAACSGSRNALSGWSQHIDGRGGVLYRADFRLAVPAAAEAPTSARPTVASDIEAGGGSTDWFATPGSDAAWLFPQATHNPRAPVVRVAIRHLPSQRVALTINGEPVEDIAFDGVSVSSDRSRAVSVWRAVRLRPGRNVLAARITDQGGAEVTTLSREVFYSGSAASAEFLPARSRLVADGASRPVIAVRLTDRDGHPVRQGVVGALHVMPPHRAAQDADAEQARQLSGLDLAPANWRVEGDDGIAYIELAPTSVSGAARLAFRFGERGEREQVVEAWLDAAARQWTLSGIAGAAVGGVRLDDRDTGNSNELDARVALFARGPVGAGWQATVRYDSDADSDRERFGGALAPRDSYTLYGDRADSGYDAASQNGLYLRVERRGFYAMYGDFDTGFDRPELARYQRAMTGGKLEFASQALRLSAFAAQSSFSHRRDEQQANGLSGPYALTRRDILPNSERVVIEVRDRLRSNIVLSRAELLRYVDYDIDYAAGLIRFREPQLSRDEALNPRFIIADYEVDGLGASFWNVGGRGEWRPSATLALGATLLRDADETATRDLAGVDVRWQPDAKTEVRAEYAVSRAEDRDPTAATAAGPNGSLTATPSGHAQAWLVEVERHDGKVDLLAYARGRDAGFGVGQSGLAGDGSTRFGVDARWRPRDSVTLGLSAWQERFTQRDVQRRALRASADWRAGERTTLRAGLSIADDQLENGERNRSVIAELAASQKLFGDRLELAGSTSFAIAGDDDSVDFPARHSLSARLLVTQGVRLVGTYEIANGGSIEASTARVGFELEPWEGARLSLNGGQQYFAELGQRSFAAYGLAQSFAVTSTLSIDASIDGQRTLGGIDLSDVIDPAHPVASGGFVGGGEMLTEDFTALTLGATWRSEQWSITGRGEYRDADSARRWGFTLGALRQLSEGRAFGALVTHHDVLGSNGAVARATLAELSWAHRPQQSRVQLLQKFAFRDDRTVGALPMGEANLSRALGATGGDVASRRLLSSTALTWDPLRHRDGRFYDNARIGAYLGLRHASDRIDQDDVAGWSAVVGLDVQFDLHERVAIGAAGSVRTGTDARASAWSAGPMLTLVPFENAALTLGYNFRGYRDRDFDAESYSRNGFYATLRVKLDASTLAGIGLGPR